VSECRRRPCGM